MARPSGDAAAGVSWSHPGGGCFTASGEGVRLGAILVGRRGRGFCCSVASSAGAGATLRLGPIVEAAQMAAQQAVAKAASDGTNSSVGQSPRPCVVDQLRLPTESAAVLLLVWFVFGAPVPPTVHQPDELNSREASGLCCTHQYGSLGGRSRASRVCFCCRQNGFSLPNNSRELAV